MGWDGGSLAIETQALLFLLWHPQYLAAILWSNVAARTLDITTVFQG